MIWLKMSQKKKFLLLLLICTVSLVVHNGRHFSWWVPEIPLQKCKHIMHLATLWNPIFFYVHVYLKMVTLFLWFTYWKLSSWTLTIVDIAIHLRYDQFSHMYHLALNQFISYCVVKWHKLPVLAFTNYLTQIYQNKEKSLCIYYHANFQNFAVATRAQTAKKDGPVETQKLKTS